MIALAKKGAKAVVVVSPFDSIFIGSVESGSFYTQKRFMKNAEGIDGIPVIGVSESSGGELRNIFGKTKNAKIRIVSNCVNNSINLSNMIATKKGKKFPNKKVVIIGHRDTVGNIGANDNSSGLAVMLELGKRLKDNDITIEFVSSCGEEELGSLGGRDYVERHKDELENIVALLEVDMVGGDTLMAVTEGNWPDLVSPIKYDEKLNKLLHSIAKERGIDLKSGPCPLGTPDSGRFVMAGVPSIWLWSPDSKFYHSDEDTVARVNFSTLENAVTLLKDLIENITKKNESPSRIGGPAVRLLSRLFTSYTSIFGPRAVPDGGSGAPDDKFNSDLDDDAQLKQEVPILSELMILNNHYQDREWHKAHYDDMKRYLSSLDKDIVVRAFYRYFDSLEQIGQYYLEKGPGIS